MILLKQARFAISSSSVFSRTDHVTFAEYGNTGPGSLGTRASFSTKLAAPIAISTVLGSASPSWIAPEFL